MTAPPQQAVPGQPAPPRPKPPEFTVTPDAELEDLRARREILAAQVSALKEQAETLDAALKQKLTGMVPPGTAVINVPPGNHTAALRLGWNTPRKFDRDAFDRAYPGVYERFMVYATPGWGWRKAGG